MLTEKEVKSLPKGDYPNTQLRKKFGPKHGSPFKRRFKVGENEFKDIVVVGNRAQRKESLRNPLKPLPTKENASIPAPVRKSIGLAGQFSGWVKKSWERLIN